MSSKNRTFLSSLFVASVSTMVSSAMATSDISALSSVTSPIDQVFSPQFNVPVENSFLSYPSDEHNLTSVVPSENNIIEQKKSSVIDQIKALKMALGLPNTALADVVDVSRQTLHSYLNTPDFDKNIHTKTLTRLSKLEEVTKLLQEGLDRSPGARAKNIFVDGNSLFDLLKSEVLEMDKIRIVINHLAEKMAASKKNLSFNEQTLHDLTSST
ncbi:hypothetical protein MNBD_UNCLBAC01-1234 [hydrothermal vent metagenome]|uniref:Uncharacterized protein n=1 Tax=hydrothermal vent metagenome TaxID=652676 RepID=A0A3B1D6N8_9ZZZZ